MDVIPTKDMFVDWREDTVETHDKIFAHDYGSTMIEQYLDDPATEKKKLHAELLEQYPMILDIFHFLQAESEKYPLISAKVVKKELLNRLDNISSEFFLEDQLNTVITETCKQNTMAMLDQSHGRVLNRSMLLEVFFRFACLIYSDRVVLRTRDPTGDSGAKKKRRLQKISASGTGSFEEVSSVRAFAMFNRNILKRFHEKLLVRWQQFRDEELWREPSQKVLTNNEAGLRQLFKKYQQRADKKFLTLNDCVNMICRDSVIGATPQMVRVCYAMSKQTVINELDDNLSKRYL